jgi:hypothetical protein
MGNTPAWNPDPATLKPTAAAPTWNPDASTLTPVNPSAEYTRGRTSMNMTRAMSGQQMDNPEDQAEAERGREAGFKAAAVTAATTGIGDLLLAPTAAAALSKVPAGRDPVTGQMLPWIVKETATEGPSLVRAGAQAIKAAGDAHPLVRQVLLSGLTALGAGKIAHALGWIGKAAADAP